MGMINLECKRYDKEIKWPKTLDLVENSIFVKGYRLSLTNLHKELFGTDFAGAHDATVDVRITIKCAIEMFKRGWL
jgi:DNA polymerase III epsilon subunit-like protein